MRFKGRAAIEAKPSLHLETRTAPLPFSARARGCVVAEVGQIDASIGRIPFLMQVPFKRGLHLMGAVGGFDIRIRPFTIAASLKEIELDGVLGDDEGMQCQIRGDMDCKATVDLDGGLVGKIARIALELDDDPDFDAELQPASAATLKTRKN